MTSLSPYRTELGVLQAVAKANTFPATYQCKNEKAAITWRARTYKANALLRKLTAQKLGLTSESEAESPFDHIKLTLDGDKVIYTERLVEGVLVIGGDAVDVAPYKLEGTSSLDLDIDFSDLETFDSEG